MAGQEQEDQMAVKVHLLHLMPPGHGRVLLLQTEVTVTDSLFGLPLPEVTGMIYQFLIPANTAILYRSNLQGITIINSQSEIQVMEVL